MMYMKAAKFEIVYRSMLHSNIWMAMDLENVGRNCYAADKEKVGGQSVAIT